MPDLQQVANLLATMRAYRNVCNHVSDYVFEHKELAHAELQKALYYDLRKRFDLGSQMTQSVLKTVVAKYKTILTNEKSWIKANFKKPQCDLVWNRDYSLSKDVFSINTLVGRAKMRFETKGVSQYFGSEWKFGTAKLVNKHGKWFLHIAVSKEFEKPADAEIENIVGVDFGINFTAVSYDSKGRTDFYSGRHIKQKRANYLHVRRQLQRRQTASSRRRLKKIGQRENRWMQDVNHCVSKALLDRQPAKTLFVIEDLTGIRGATERVWQKYRYVQVSWAFYDLRQKLEYKTKMRNCLVIAADRNNTSQMCPKCGHTARNNRNRKKHLFCCKNCGYMSNDDRVAGMNLHRKGIEYLSELVLVQDTSG
jgi:IS605 OrfB family transposase